MPTKAGGAPATYGVTDYLMAFKKPGNEDAVKAFYDLYYPPDQVNTFIKAEGFLPVTKSGVEQFSTDPKLKVYLDTLTDAKLTPTDDPSWDKVKLAVQQNLGAAVAPNGDPKAVLDKLQAAGRVRRLSVSRAHSGSRGRRRPGTPHRPHPGGAGPRRAAAARRAAGCALLWLGPALLLIAGGGVLPGRRARAGLVRDYSITGLRKGSAGPGQLPPSAGPPGPGNGAAQHGDLGRRGAGADPGDQPRPGPVPVQGVLRPQGSCAGR